MSDPEQINKLKSELKTWEKAFSTANGGRKAGRDDIRKDAAIAAKYKEYDRLRRPPPKKSESQSKPNPSRTDKDPRPTSRSQPIASTPQKRKSQFAQPALPVAHILPDDEEEDEVEPTPAAIRMQLGPTPQKDGHILSLFDSLPSVTPSKSRSVLTAIEGNIAATPNKNQSRNTTIAESPAIENVRGSRTPASSGKRFMLDTFATPLKRKRDDEDQAHATPSSTLKLLATPAFLRRSNTISIMETLAEEGERDHETLGLTRAREPPFKKKKGFIRSLSSIIQGMRKEEDDRLDEEMEMMREWEDGHSPTEPGLEESQSIHRPDAKVLVEDSQIVMPLGPDRGIESEEEEEEEEEQDGQPRKPWKKKGLKRQTKRVIMRPVTHKLKKPDSQVHADSIDAEYLEAVAETQLPTVTLPEHDVDGSESDYSDTEAKLQRAQSKSNAKAAAKAPSASTKETGGPIKRAARMISAGAHANFRKLKIKNQNTKANGRGRFGRR
ncbi:DNA replication/checkpoint protein [Delphinella strobiligena]|nr:DNA replication/checkpoint protein [Delphinella strobiligena]